MLSWFYRLLKYTNNDDAGISCVSKNSYGAKARHVKNYAQCCNCLCVVESKRNGERHQYGESKYEEFYSKEQRDSRYDAAMKHRHNVLA